MQLSIAWWIHFTIEYDVHDKNRHEDQIGKMPE